jgi:hypothetical protein
MVVSDRAEASGHGPISTFSKAVIGGADDPDCDRG